MSAPTRSDSTFDDPDTWRSQGHYLEGPEGRIFYRVAGSGPALLLLHGFPTSSWDFRKVWEPLARRYTLVTLDYIGFGFSSKPADGTYTIQSYADQVERLMNHLGIEHYHLLAHDLGDTVAQELLARRTDLLSIFMLNGGLFPEAHRPRLAQSFLSSPFGFLFSRLMTKSSFEKSLSAIFGAQTQPSPAELSGYWKCIRSENGQRLFHLLIRYMSEREKFRERWVRAITDTSVPIGFCFGLGDPVSGKPMLARLQELKRSPYVIELETIGHYPQVEAPAAVLTAYEKFRLFTRT